MVSHHGGHELELITFCTIPSSNSKRLFKQRGSGNKDDRERGATDEIRPGFLGGLGGGRLAEIFMIGNLHIYTK